MWTMAKFRGFNRLMLRSRRGVTLVELLLASSLTIIMGFWVATWLSKPARIQQKFVAILDEQKALRATDTWMNDMKQMIPGSLSLDSGAGAGPLAIQIAGEGAPVQVRYTFQPESSGSGGSLVRTVGGTATVILSGLATPEASLPLFRIEPRLRILTLDLRLKTAKSSDVRVVRRASMPN
jgi:hypothetical protein